MLEHREGFSTEFGEAGVEGFDVLVILAVAAITENFSGLETSFDVGFGDIQKHYGLDFVVGVFCGVHHGVFFAEPATDGREDKRLFGELGFFKVGQDPFVKDVGRDEGAVVGIALVDFGFFFTNDDAGREKFGA